MPIGPKRMPFLDHIVELRWRILVVAGTVAVLSLITYPFAFTPILSFMIAPIKDLLPSGGKLVLSGPFEGFTFRFKVAMWAALIAASPVIIWQALAFFLPALKPKERRWFLPTVFSTIVLFLTGLAFCYTIIMRPAFVWMIGQGTSDVTTALAFADRWTGGIMLLLVAFGIAFEVPVVIFYLIAFNVVPYSKFREHWRFVYVGLMIFAAVATPDWSPVTMGALFAALVVLYEGSLLLARVVFSRRLKRLALERAEQG